MDPNVFIGEVYRRMALRMPVREVIQVDEFVASAQAYEECWRDFYASVLPADRAARIVDVGSGNGEFVALCHTLGYRQITAVDFRATEKFTEICATYSNVHAIDLRELSAITSVS